MLSVPADFPQAGAAAFLRLPTSAGECEQPLPCRIVQHRTDGTVVVAIEERWKRATSTRTVEATDLFATREEAIPAPVKGKRTTKPRRAPARSAASANARPQAPAAPKGRRDSAEDAAADAAAKGK